MYALYEKREEPNGYRYLFERKVSLFGYKSGYIPKLLAKTLRGTDSQPFSWHVDVDRELNDSGSPKHTLVINLKPKAAIPNLSLYELVDVWGFSSSGWTPLMFYLRGLFVDEVPNAYNEKDFLRFPKELHDPIFSMMYLSGTIEKGKVVGKWTLPGPSPTNSVLLWPEPFKYFEEKANEVMARPR